MRWFRRAQVVSVVAIRVSLQERGALGMGSEVV